MISIEILNCDNDLLLGVHTFYFDEIVLGSSKTCNIIIADKSIQKKHLHIEVNDSNAFCSTIQSGVYYFCNGKKFSGKKMYRQSDVISIGTTSFRVIDFKKTTIQDIDISKQYTNAITHFPPAEKVLAEIEKEFIALENE
jgi:hypothetical protein